MASTTTAADTAKSIPLPTYDGNPDEFQKWWLRFKAYAAVKKFSNAIKRTADANLPGTEAEDVSSSAAKAVALERNALAIASLTLAFQTDGLLNMITKAQSTDWPNGKAYEVIDALFKKFQPVDTISRVEMRNRLNKIGMKPTQDPKVLFDKIASLQNAYNDSTRNIDEEDLIALVLDKAPKIYKSILTAEQHAKGNTLALSDL